MVDVVETLIVKLGVQGAETLPAAGKAIDAITIATEKMDRAVRASEQRWTNIVGKVEPAVRSLSAFGKATKIISDYQEQGIGTTAEYTLVTESMVNKLLKGVGTAEQLGRSFEDLTASFDPATSSVKRLESVFGALSAGINTYVKDADLAKAATELLATSFNRLSIQTEAAQRNARAWQAYRQPALSQARINEFAGVKTDFSESTLRFQNKTPDVETRATDITAFGAALDSHRAKYDQLFAAGLKYKNLLAEIRHDASLVVGGENLVAPAITKAKTDFAKQVRDLTGVTAAQKEADAAAEEAAAAQKLQAAAAQKYHDSLNPLLPLQREYIAELKELASLRESGHLSRPEAVTLVGKATDTFEAKSRKATGKDAADRKAAEEQARLNAATQTYLDILDPTADATRKYAAALSDLNELQEKGKLSSLGAAVVEAKLTTEYEKQIRVLTGVAEAERKAGAAKKQGKADAQTAENAQERLAASAQAYKDKLDPLAGVNRRYKEALAEVVSLEKTGVLTRMEAVKVTSQLKREYEDLSSATKAAHDANNGLSRGMLGATQQSRAMQFAVTNLSFQLNDVFTSLASGQSITRTMAQQFGQFIQVFQQGGGVKNVLAEAGSTFLRLLTPLNLFLVGVAAVGAGLLVLISRANQTETRLRTFGVTLNAMGTRGSATALGLDEIVKGLRDTGTAADDAFKAVQHFARVPGINPASAAKLVPLARDIAAVTGQDFGSLGEQMAQAFSKGTDEAIKFAQAVGGPNSLTSKEIENMQTMARHGDRAGALRIEIAALQRQFGGSFQAAMSDSTKAMNSLGAAWNNFLDALSKTSIVQGARNAVIGMLQGIANAVNAPNPQTEIERSNTARRAQGFAPLTPAQEQELENQRRGQDNVVGGALRGATSTFTNQQFTTSANAALTQVDPTVVTDFNRALIESGMRAIITSTTGGHHAAGSQHYTSNTVTGMGEALDYNLIDPITNHVIPHSDAHIAGSAAATAYRDFEYRFKGYRPDENRAGVDFNDPGHVDRGQISGAAPGRLAGRLGGGPRPSEQTFGTGVLSKSREIAEPLTVPEGLNEAQKAALLDRQKFDAELLKSNKLVGESKVYWQAYVQALGEGTTDIDKVNLAEQAGVQAVSMWRAEIDKASQTQRIANDLALEEARTYGTDVVAGYRAAAEGAAKLAVRAGDAYSVSAKTQEILQTQATQAIRAGNEAVAAARPQIANQQLLVEATIKGTAAAQDQQIANAAAEKTQDALNRAKAAGIPLLEEEAKKLYASALAQEKLTAEQRASIAASEQINQTRLQIQTTQLETGLTASGRPQDEITRQTDLLNIAQQLNTTYRQAKPEIKETFLAVNTGLADAKFALTQVQREQQKWNDLVSELANSIQNDLTKSIENAFNGDKVDDWGTRVKKWISSAASQLSSSLFIKPALGTVSGALGFGTAAQSLGSFGNLLGTGNTSSSTSGGDLQIKKNDDGTFSLSTVSSGVSLLSGGTSLLGGGGGLLSSLNSFGAKLGFATSTPALSTSEISSLGDLIGIDSKSLGFLGQSGTTSGSLFGSTTLGGALGGIGAGVGAGFTLNSLLGGNAIGGSAGSATGSLLGTLAGSFVGMPFLGGIIGGASGGGLGGLFGQSHKRSNATGLSIDLSTGDVSSFQSSGSKENDRTARELRDSISDFTKDIQDTTKGTVSGYINPQVTDQGIKLDYSIPGYGSGTYKAEDSQDAIDKAELAIARGLTGISTTMKTVIDQVTDPKKLDAALKFADTYAKIETAAKDAFSSIPSDLDIAGPFKKAKDDIKDQFDDIAADAKKFGLSLTPVTDALNEANKRLTKDFDRYITDLTTAVEDPLQSLVDIEKRAGDARLKDAKEVNGNILAVNKYNALALDKIWDDSTKSIKDFQKDLKSGESSGLTATQRLKSAQSDYDALLTDVKAGKSSKFEDFVTAGKNLYSLSTTAYGQGPKTATLRKDLLAALDGVLASRSFASGTKATPPGVILVGEQGPELIAQPGGLQVHSSRELQKVVSDIAPHSGPTSNSASNLSLVSNSSAAAQHSSTSISVKNIIAAIEKAAPARAFAEGTKGTPPGMILVGEHGPELISQPGGLQVYPHRETERILSKMQAANDDHRAFSSGTLATPPGTILVGEQGRELMGLTQGRSFADGTDGRLYDWMVYQGNGVAGAQGQQNRETTVDLTDVEELLNKQLAEMKANTEISRVGHLETGRKVDKQTDEMKKPALYEPKRRKVAA